VYNSFVIHASVKPSVETPALCAIAIWLGLQLAALALCAARFMFWARSPVVSEQLAFDVVIAVQVFCASLFFPQLLGTWRSTLLAMVTAIVFGQLAAELSDTAQFSLFFAEIYVIAWIAALHFILRSLTTNVSRLLATSLVTMISIGGPLLWYLRVEFSGADSASPHSRSFSHFGPLAGAISQIGPDRSLFPWLFVAIAILAAGIHFVRKRARQKIS
jgi:hypothetical protein